VEVTELVTHKRKERRKLSVEEINTTLIDLIWDLACVLPFFAVPYEVLPPFLNKDECILCATILQCEPHQASGLYPKWTDEECQFYQIFQPLRFLLTQLGSAQGMVPYGFDRDIVTQS
jgi:hypothetical protein